VCQKRASGCQCHIMGVPEESKQLSLSFLFADCLFCIDHKRLLNFRPKVQGLEMLQQVLGTL